MTYGKRTLIAVDQLLNTLLGGWPDETLSSRCYRWARDGVRAWPRRVVDGLFFWQREHCKSSYESEREGRQSPPELSRQEGAGLGNANQAGRGMDSALKVGRQARV